MHEHAFISTILNNISSLASDKKISKVNIEVGELVGIDPHHLKEHLLEHVDYDIQLIVKPSLIECPCGYRGRATIVERLHDKVIFSCPWCDDPMEVMNIVEGDKIKILSINYH